MLGQDFDPITGDIISDTGITNVMSIPDDSGMNWTDVLDAQASISTGGDVNPPDWVKDWVSQYAPGNAPAPGQTTADFITNILKIASPVAVAAFQSKQSQAIAQGKLTKVTPGYTPTSSGLGLSNITAGFSGILPIALIGAAAYFLFGRKGSKKKGR